MVYKRYFRNNMGGSTLPVGMVWNYIGGIGIDLNRCLHPDLDTSLGCSNASCASAITSEN